MKTNIDVRNCVRILWNRKIKMAIDLAILVVVWLPDCRIPYKRNSQPARVLHTRKIEKHSRLTAHLIAERQKATINQVWNWNHSSSSFFSPFVSFLHSHSVKAFILLFNSMYTLINEQLNDINYNHIGSGDFRLPLFLFFAHKQLKVLFPLDHRTSLYVCICLFLLCCYFFLIAYHGLMRAYGVYNVLTFCACSHLCILYILSSRSCWLHNHLSLCRQQ